MVRGDKTAHRNNRLISPKASGTIGPRGARPDKSTIERLSFIKFLYGLGVEQSRAAEPMNAASLLTLHDSVELFLQLASECLDVGKTGMNFLEYWNILSSKLPDGGGLTQKEAMRRLNSARVALKHHGTRPSRGDVEAFRVTTTTFFAENTHRAFGVSFESLSLIDLVAYEVVRSTLEQAQQQMSDGKFSDALSSSRLAFHRLLDQYEGTIRNHFGLSPFPFAVNKGYFRFHSTELSWFTDTHDLIEEIRTSFEAVEEALKILSLGLDGRKYEKFRMLTPNVNQKRDGNYSLTWGRTRQKMTFTKSDAEYCVDFVIEAALILQQFGFEGPTSELGKHVSPRRKR
jgi:hypothetical protein